MRNYSLNELFNFTRAELFALHAKIVAEMPFLTDAECIRALETLRGIRRVLAALNYRPG